MKLFSQVQGSMDSQTLDNTDLGNQQKIKVLQGLSGKLNQLKKSEDKSPSLIKREI